SSPRRASVPHRQQCACTTRSASLNQLPWHELDQPTEHVLSTLNVVGPVPGVYPHADVVCNEVASHAHELVGLDGQGLGQPQLVREDDRVVSAHRVFLFPALRHRARSLTVRSKAEYMA